MRAARLAPLVVLLTLAGPALGASSPRTVVVARDGQALPSSLKAPRDCLGAPTRCVNGTGGVELVYLVKGKLRGSGRMGTVLTDANCQADSYGISHCLNAVRVDGGGEIVVRHDHRMSNDACLAPGERVRLRLA